MFIENRLIILFGILHCSAVPQSYKPVVLVHGILSTGGELYQLAQQIRIAHSGTNVTVLQYVENKLETLEPLKGQLNRLTELLEPVMRSSPNGIHLICHSQGRTHW